ncbi:MAG: hypothetical protein U9R53_10380 [Chloroflexota bacterium]|nr:hypothetical protein [Chloroflexota bacterium]
MTEETINLTQRRLKTPRAAALAGIIFAILFIISIVLIRISIPESLNDSGTWLADNSGRISFAIGLVPFAGIAFLWFLGVIRDRLGDFEDRFFSTVFFGSGLLFIAMTFVSAAVAGTILNIFTVQPEGLGQTPTYAFNRVFMYLIINVYGLRMAGVFMMSLGTIWIKTKVMPRLLVFLTYGLSLVLMLGLNLSLWMSLAFPGWVLVISVTILILNFRRRKTLTTAEMEETSSTDRTILD